MKLLTLIFFMTIGTVVFAQSKESNCCDDKKEGSVTKKMCEVPESTSKVEVKKEVTTTSTAPATTVEVKKEIGKQEKVIVNEQKKKDCCTVEKSETGKEKEKE